MLWSRILLWPILLIFLPQFLISDVFAQSYEHRIIFRYRSDINPKKSNLVSKVREKNVLSVDYPSPRFPHSIRTALLNGTSSYIQIELQKEFDSSAFENQIAHGFTITAWICPEFVDELRPILWIQNGFLLAIQDGAVVGEVMVEKDTVEKESLKISTEPNLIQANEWSMLAFRDSLDSSQSPQKIHHLELWINHQKIVEKMITVEQGSYAVKKKIQGKAAIAGLGVYQIEKEDKRGPIRFFAGLMMALEMKNYPVDPKYLQLYPPDDLTLYFGLPAYLDHSLESKTDIAEKRILSSFLPNLNPLCYIPFQNISYIPSGLTVVKSDRYERYPYQIYLALNWKDEQGRTNQDDKNPPIIAHLRPENGNNKVIRYFYLDGELRAESIAAIALFNSGRQNVLFVLSAERHNENGNVYQTIGKYELRSTFRFRNAIWPSRYWHIPIYASKNDIMDGGQAWMNLHPQEGDSSVLWIGTFAHCVNSSEIAESDSLGWLYKFLVSDNGNLMNPSTGEENIVSGSKVMYQRAWRMPTYFEAGSKEQLSNINGGILIEENGQTFWILVEGYGEKLNFLRKYPFDEQNGFRHSMAYFPVPAGTKAIDLIDPAHLVTFSVSGCNYLQNENAYYPWQKVCFPFIYSIPLEKFHKN